MAGSTEMLDAENEPELDEPQPVRTRMAIAVLSLIGLLISGYLLLHRLGFLGTLACGTGSCDTVQTSPWATFLGLPVPLIGVGGYLGLLAVALAGIHPQPQRERMIAGALLGMSTIALLFSAYLTAIEAFRIHAWCRYCVASAIIISIIFVLALPEYRRMRAAGTA